jgi:hypothetical protein
MRPFDDRQGTAVHVSLNDGENRPIAVGLLSIRDTGRTVGTERSKE